MKNLDGTYTPNMTTIMLQAEKYYPATPIKYKPKKINIDAIVINTMKLGKHFPLVAHNL